MDLEALRRWGFDEEWRAAAGHALPARVAAEHKGGYLIVTARGDLPAVAAGRLRRAAQEPAVGDWVAFEEPATAGGHAMITGVLPRRTLLARRSAARDEEQILAANVDAVLLVSALTRDLNLRRLERGLALSLESGAAPAIVLTKADLCDDVDAARAGVAQVARGVPVLVVSAKTGEGMSELSALLRPGSTLVLLGTSGVGKSTLVNLWLGSEQQAVAEIADSGKGRHTTTHRELLALPGGALVIDTPGVRELGLWDSAAGVSEAFPEIEALGAGCRFNDCAHDGEPGCAVAAAVDQGALARERLDSFLRLRREVAHATLQRDARARSEASRKARQVGRRLNDFYKKRGR